MTYNRNVYVTGQIWFQVKFHFPLFQTYYQIHKTKEIQINLG